MVVNRLFELMLLAVVLVLVMTVNRLADLLDQAGSNTFTGFKINQLILDRAGTGIDDKDGFSPLWASSMIDTYRETRLSI